MSLKFKTQDDVTAVEYAFFFFSVLMKHVTYVFQDTGKPACLL